MIFFSQVTALLQINGLLFRLKHYEFCKDKDENILDSYCKYNSFITAFHDIVAKYSSTACLATLFNIYPKEELKTTSSSEILRHKLLEAKRVLEDLFSCLFTSPFTDRFPVMTYKTELGKYSSSQPILFKGHHQM